MNVRPVGASCSTGQTDRQDEANSRFSQFCERALKLKQTNKHKHAYNMIIIYETRRLLIVTIFCTSINTYFATVSDWSLTCCSFVEGPNTVSTYIFTRKWPYTLSVKLSDFTV